MSIITQFTSYLNSTHAPLLHVTISMTKISQNEAVSPYTAHNNKGRHERTQENFSALEHNLYLKSRLVS